jgi:uncharacterized protein (TIGR04562 family)
MKPDMTKLEQKWKIGERVLDVLISGTSFLDSREGFLGSFRNIDDAEQFLEAYGFDLNDPIERAELHGTMQEALLFIRTYFLKPHAPSGLALEIPKKFFEIHDIRELLIYSGSPQNPEMRLWACAILKLVHTISHIDRDMRTHFFPDIQMQILDRFYRYLHRDENNHLYIGKSVEDPLRVNLVEFQVKPKKARDSTLMKLLHKPESVAEELFDRVGVRVVTKNRVDCIRVIQFLEHNNVVVPANIKPSRSRNTLVQIDAFREILKREGPKLFSNELTESQFIDDLESVPYGNTTSGENRFSSEHYRAIQFTCRQLIKIKNPLSDHIRNLKSITRGMDLGPELMSAIERVDQKHIQRVTRFFYPYEVQVMDEASFHENEKGRSAHGQYKLAQQKAAMARVMGALATGPT